MITTHYDYQYKEIKRLQPIQNILPEKQKRIAVGSDMSQKYREEQ